MKDIFQYFEKHLGQSVMVTILAGIVYALVYMLTKSTWFNGFMTKISDRFLDKVMKKKTDVTKIRTITESDILNHEIFKYIDFWMYSKVPTIQFSTEYRTVVFRKYLAIYLKKHKENIKSYVDDKKFETMDDPTLWNSLLTLINDTIYDYEKEMENSGIPKIVIEKMKIKNNDVISLTIDLISGVCDSQFYTSDKNLLKIYSILNIMLSILENTISNSEHICNSINGQLKGLSMDGKKEP
jgi:hypothetical protein